MKIKFILSFFTFFFVLHPVAGRAFVPQTPHLLYLVEQKIKQPSGLQAVQSKTIVDKESAWQRDISIKEKLAYLFPNRLRTEILSDTGTSFSVESGTGFIRVRNGTTISRKKSAIDLYTDILLYREHESLEQQLALSGIDTKTVTLQRYKGAICYVIGRPGEKDQPFSGLWIDKNTFFPVKYAVAQNGWMVECDYANWQKTSRTWYPMQVDIYLDSRLFAVIKVDDIALKAGFSSALFDVAHIERLYPEEKKEFNFQDEPEKTDDLDKRIEEFKKLYE